MNGFIEAQRELAVSLARVHEHLALTAMQQIGANAASWSDVMTRRDEMQAILEEHAQQTPSPDGITDLERVKLDSWGLDTVLYDPLPAKPTYKVPLLGVHEVKLVLSTSPSEDVAAHSSAWPNTDLDFPSYPLKYIRLKFKGKQNKTQSGLVVISPDMPAMAIHGDDIRYIEKDERVKPHWEHGHEFMSKVEKIFGQEALEVLSETAVVALSGAIRASHAELQNYDNGQYWEML